MKKSSSNSFKERDKATLPRERLALLGADKLTNAELLAIILGSGTKGKNVLHLCEEILHHYEGLYQLGNAAWQELMQIEGLGEVKAKILNAVFELGKRREQEIRNRTLLRINNIEQAKKYIVMHFPKLYADSNVEYFYVIYFNRANAVVLFKEISQGGFSATVVDVRVVLRYALQCSATSMILVHNHPSGNPKPSNEDILLTKKIKDAADIMDIKVLDHIIVTYKETFSFLDNDLL
ncbi:MAG: DNA repair protein RadC [Bacteroidia bacterium]|nr:DNA repair protein RadC [Bacteroidia bacterium]MDW8347785.1 DNA repair protein RadC [Bacteroidia bacterium]